MTDLSVARTFYHTFSSVMPSLSILSMDTEVSSWNFHFDIAISTRAQRTSLTVMLLKNERVTLNAFRLIDDLRKLAID